MVKRTLSIIFLQAIILHILLTTNLMETNPIMIDNYQVDFNRFIKDEIGSAIITGGVTNNDVQLEALIPMDEVKYHRGVQLRISVAGDFTIGYDEDYGYHYSFADEINRQEQNYDYFLANVKDIFSSDDMTLVNLETTFTNSNVKANKTFKFKGDPEWVEILKRGSIEGVNLANNHIYDYLEKGYHDTIDTLEKLGIGYFGYENQFIAKVKGIRVGVLGYTGWDYSESMRKTIKNDLHYLKQFTDLIIVSFHWGNERNYYPSKTQIQLGHYTIDEGADLVFGHHPHVIQGIENYKDRFIVYSLGNFLFGGNKNPSDKDTFIFQQTFSFSQDKRLMDVKDITIIPVSISSVTNRNNYQPTPLTGQERLRVEKKINDLASIFK